VRCRDLQDLNVRKTVNLKARGSLVEDEAQDWIDAIREACQKRHLWSGDVLKEIRPIAKTSEVLYSTPRNMCPFNSCHKAYIDDLAMVLQALRTACTPAVKNEENTFLVQDVTTILLEALRSSSIIQVMCVSLFLLHV